MQLAAVFFDLDGTLLDSAPALGAALNAVRNRAGLNPLSAEIIRPYASTGTSGLLRMGIGEQHPQFQAMREAFLQEYDAHSLRLSRPFTGIPALLEELHRRGIAWGVVTNKAKRFTDPIMATDWWPIAPISVVSADEVAHPKPDPAAILLACHRAGVPPEHCVYVGDAERDIAAGRSAGMRTLGVSFGYIEPHSPPSTWGASAVVDTVDAILPALLRLTQTTTST